MSPPVKVNDFPSWVRFIWIAGLLLPLGKMAWNWLGRQRVEQWPTAIGKIESTTIIEPDATFFKPAEQQPYRVEIGYSYSAVGVEHRGQYRRDFAYHAAAEGFLRELKGQSIEVRYNPSRPAQSKILEAAIEALLARRESQTTPSPEGELLAPGDAFRYRFCSFVAGCGFLVSLWFYLVALMGRPIEWSPLRFILQFGAIVMWIPAFNSIQQRGVSLSHTGWNEWKILAGEWPEWMRYIVFASIANGFVCEVIFMAPLLSGSKARFAAGGFWQWSSVGWMVFYSSSCAILYTAPTRERKQNT